MPADAPSQVQLFVTCIVDTIYPAVGEAVVDVLEGLGVEVHFPEAQTCCGQPAYNAGFHPEARRLALHCLDVFEKSPALLVTPSGSCAAMLVHGYADLFSHQPDNLARAQRLAARTYEFSQFLTDVLDVNPERLGLDRGPAQRVTYHPSCHLLRGLGVRDAAEKLLRAVPTVDLTPLPNADQCCGFGGLFAVKHDDVSAAMLNRKLEHVAATGAETLVGCDMSCLMHIQGGLSRDGTRVRCVHLAQVLARPGVRQ